MIGSLSAHVWADQAGLVQFVNGDVEVTPATGSAHALHKGDPVNEGDTITSAKAATAQIKMEDGGFIAVRPETQMKIDSFKYGTAGEPERSFLSITKGGFRAITGLVGRVNKEDYRITTPAGVIGIRGTDHETVMVLEGSNSGESPGVYNMVNMGETTLTTNKGAINIMPNQIGYAAGMDRVPEIIIQQINPNRFSLTPVQQILPGPPPPRPPAPTFLMTVPKGVGH